ncbi:MAG: TonB-dependent receptor [Alphaproteobacteria bacterium]|nr:TonB-dependent receptor [Alphaproteobacteria bacterium]MBU0793760.1 TonB-dependent receptor [Alphaproteobacteria bacterium]MBU0877699.1 TonB-dependent receptor [Alphaproteobacteria bacterium]MBU1768075.1 TonB-dependent receptor [Alphaproteobacteria bacterium]
MALSSVAAAAQEGAIAQDDFAEGEIEEVIVSGQRERGAVLGNAIPETQLRPADIRALGVSTISDLLTELGPELQSASGRPPVTLLEGHRIASFREIARLPAEAIARIDILPEEVGLRYGYGADQKVMNIVLRQRFRAFTGEIDRRIPTAGAGSSLELEGGFFLIRNSQRVNINAEHNSVDPILETDRGLEGPESPARSLQPTQEDLTLNASYSRPIGERTKATLSGELVTARRDSLVGLVLPGVTIAAGTPFAPGSEDVVFYPQLPGTGALDRSSRSQTGELGLTINAERSTGQWTLTANYVRAETRGITARPFDLSDYAAALAAGDPVADPSLPIAAAFLVSRPADLTRSNSDTANLDFIHNRALLNLPGGEVMATVKFSGALTRIENLREQDLVASVRQLGRDSASGSLNFDIPLTSGSSGIGRMSANANIGVEHYSDVGTLRNLGAGLNWSPLDFLSLSAGYSDEEAAAGIQQVGDVQTLTPFVPIFDFVRGESVLVTTITGGNRDLDKSRVETIRLGADFSILREPRLRLDVSYNRRRTEGGVSAFPGVTADTAAAFPERFHRDESGQLVLVDLRPINISEQKREVLRWGFSLSKRLRTPQSQIDAMRAAFQRRQAERAKRSEGAGRPREEGAAPGNTEAPSPGAESSGPAGGFGPGGRAGRGGPGGGRGGGRVDFSLHHEWALTNSTQLAPGLPVLDLLSGDTLGDTTGPSRHLIEVRAGISQSGYGLRLTGEWKSATRVNGSVGVPSSRLRFSDLAKIDLRAFVTFNQMPSLLEKAPFLRGVRLQIGVDNVFDARQRVTDGNGDVPFAYQPALIDPVGRTLRLSIRKLL